MLVKAGALIELWFPAEKNRREVKAASVVNLAVSHDARLLATCAWDGKIHLWDVETGELRDVFAGQLVGFFGLAFSSDDTRLAAGGFDGSVTLWDLVTSPRRQVAQWKAARRWCDWLEFREDDTALITSGEPLQENERFRTVIRCWPAPTLAEIDRQLLRAGPEPIR